MYVHRAAPAAITTPHTQTIIWTLSIQAFPSRLYRTILILPFRPQSAQKPSKQNSTQDDVRTKQTPCPHHTLSIKSKTAPPPSPHPKPQRPDPPSSPLPNRVFPQSSAPHQASSSAPKSPHSASATTPDFASVGPPDSSSAASPTKRAHEAHSGRPLVAEVVAGAIR